MKAETLKERPNYELLKQTDIVNYYHLQLPQWLFFDHRYAKLSIEAKVTYSMLFYRFQMSKLNGWINEKGEVFIIYTRKDLSKILNISEKRVSAAMNNLKQHELIWERRCGRGFANQIYLANVKISAEDATRTAGGPLDPPNTKTDIKDECNGEVENNVDSLRLDEMAVLDDEAPNGEKGDRSRKSGFFSCSDSKGAALEPSNRTFKNRQNGVSKTEASAVQEQPNRPPSYKDFRFIEPNHINHSQSESSPYAHTRARWDGLAERNDTDAIKDLIEQAELRVFSENEAAVMKDAIERLYFMQSITIGNAIYPNERIREHLRRINALIVEDALFRISNNTKTKIRNSSAYVVTVLFNTIMESGSDLIVDPYLNSLRAKPEVGKTKVGGG